jgi:muramoyltetrapeptide carboxypeptidase
MNLFLSPPALRPGQTVALISTARKLSPEDVAIGIQCLTDWGLKVKIGDNLFAESGQFAGTDAQRLADLQAALDDPEIDAIICARGGYGTSRILDQVNFEALLRHPKWIAGFSDVTALHTHLHGLHLQSIHSTMPILFDTDDRASMESLRKVLFGESQTYTIPPDPLNRMGMASGRLIGGNLSLLASVIGTHSDVDTAGKILFVEDTDEYLYHLDRMMIQLKRGGKLSGLAGLVVGSFTDIHDNGVPFGKTAYEIIAEAVAEYDFPVCFHFPTGHSPENLALICGREARLAVSPDAVQLKQ